MSFSPETIMAYVDGELDLVTARHIEAAMANDAELAAQVRAQRALRQKLSARFDPILDEPVPDALLKRFAVDTSLAARRTARAGRFARLTRSVQWGALAASLAIGLLAGHFFWSRPSGLVVERGGQLMAAGALDKALETQLAWSQAANAPTHIGLTFRDTNGKICRTFEGERLSGVACRSGSQWQLLHALSGGRETSQQYRQASSGALDEIAEGLMGTTDAFDAVQEREARLKKWK